MVKIPNMLEENVDYELVVADHDHWHIRILNGEFIESVISFGSIQLGKDDMLHFDFTLHYSPDPDLTVDDIEIQRYAGKILESVMVSSLDNMEKNE